MDYPVCQGFTGFSFNQSLPQPELGLELKFEMKVKVKGLASR
jgi:hypothetical protein